MEIESITIKLCPTFWIKYSILAGYLDLQRGMMDDINKKIGRDKGVDADLLKSLDTSIDLCRKQIEELNKYLYQELCVFPEV